MPYIRLSDKKALDTRGPETPGELNYLITKLILQYVKEHGQGYQIYNDAVGALECAKLELYRRRIADYEEGKKATNGDVYE